MYWIGIVLVRHLGGLFRTNMTFYPTADYLPARVCLTRNT